MDGSLLHREEMKAGDWASGAYNSCRPFRQVRKVVGKYRLDRGVARPI
jgi:hypothetical protein